MIKSHRKKIFLSSVNDAIFFDSIIGINQYQILDKKILLVEEGIKQDSFDKNVMNYIASSMVEKYFTKMLRDKKVKNIVYIFETLDPIMIRKNINERILSKLNKNSNVEYNIISSKNISPVVKCKYTKSGFANIYYKD